MIRKANKWILMVSAALLLSGCFQDNEQQQMLKQAVAIESADECHLCGMIIANFPGPKGESFVKNQEQVHKFCSTRDLFAFYLQPENTRQVTQMFVHDMSQTPWDKVNDEHFIDAKKAWYVIGSSKRGAMGQTLASFAKKEDATAFSKEFGGNVYPFAEITIDIL